MITEEQRGAVLTAVDRAVEAAVDAREAMAASMRVIADSLPHYNWVGIYLLNGAMLELGPYVGAATDHTRIPVGRGVCGTAVAENANQVIADVRSLDNYLACSVETRSEIVVLIRHPKSGAILGQIDADGHAVGAFDASDEALLEAIAGRLAPVLAAAAAETGA
jgi:GAF domain-containing protein